MGINLEKMSDKQLIDLFKSLYDAIYVAECYGVFDLALMGKVVEELKRRGYVIVEKPGVEVIKSN